jgi:hypothetical protein
MQARSFSEVNQGPVTEPRPGNQLATLRVIKTRVANSQFTEANHQFAPVKKHCSDVKTACDLCRGAAVSRRLVRHAAPSAIKTFPALQVLYLRHDETEADPDA